MSRAKRLLDLLQALRRRRRPVSGQALADELGVSLRTIYRDIQTLTAQGACIEGEAGVGFVLRPGFVIPPLMFSEAEIEALVLGSRWVAQCTDQPLALAARNALAKIAAVLPNDLREAADASTLLVGPSEAVVAAESIDLSIIRQSIRSETKIAISYRAASGVSSRRVIWPVALAFFDRVRVLAAWCETRQAFRHFRIDRIAEWEPLDDRCPRRRRTLMREWREIEGIPDLI